MREDGFVCKQCGRCSDETKRKRRLVMERVAAVMKRFCKKKKV